MRRSLRPVILLAFAARLAACDASAPGAAEVGDALAAVGSDDAGSTAAGDATGVGATASDAAADVGPSCAPSAAQDRYCDGVDEDCDGRTDEDWAPAVVACGALACRPSGESTCVGGALGDKCQPRASEIDATCDGVDDDCDGATDEDYAPVATTCGVGACRASGVTRCDGGVARDDCTAGPRAARDASCDGVDDDCDGATDEEYAPRATRCGAGVCAGSGLSACVAGREDEGCGTAEPRDQDCDGVDDDCDGAADEDYLPRATRCGVGACARAGTTRCDAGVEHDSCAVGPAAAGDATCDGVDDDCDGQRDEDWVETATACGLGPCARAGVLQCRAGEPVDTCAPGAAAAADATCDGFDDDCSGAPDEDFAPGVSHCGSGACATSGTTACGVGGAVDVCQPLAPDCGAAQCGDDGCGGSCGSCAPTGLACLAASCGADRQCHTSVVADRCFIDGACWDAGQADPSGGCRACMPGLAADAWSPAADLASCDDHDAKTWVDWCWEGACRGFEERVEPTLAGSTMDWFDTTGPAVSDGGPGFLAVARTPTPGQTYYIHLTTYGAALQGVSQETGSQWIPNRPTPTAAGLLVEENRLWEWVDGAWSSTPSAGSLRAAWPVASPSPADNYARFDHLLRVTSGAGAPQVLGTGRTPGAATDLVVRRCSGGASWVCAGDLVRADTLKASYTAGLVRFGGETLIAVNDKSSAPTSHRILRYSPEAGWGVDASLDHPAAGRLLVGLEKVGGGLTPETLVGTVAGGGLVVTRLSGWSEVAVAGLPSPLSWDDIREWQGYVVILARATAGAETTAMLVYAPAAADLTNSASWRWRKLLSTADRRRVDAIGADANHLFLVGSSPDATTERRTTWRFEAPAGDGPPLFAERFDALDPTRWKALAQGAVGAPNWRLDDQGVMDSGNCFDVESDEAVVAKLGAVLWAPSVSWGDGRLTVAVRPSDDDGWGVEYGMQGPSDYYRVSFDRQRSFARLVRSTGGAVTTLDEDTGFTPSLETWHLIEVVRAGAHHVVSLDGVPVLAADDDTFASGAVGLYAWSMSAVRFDDLRVHP